jgi:hypothetical protein
MGGRPKTSTPADRRLKANRDKPATPPAKKAAPAKFGSPAWDAKYQTKGKK